MAKQTGLGARFLVGGNDLSGDINALDTVGTTKALLDTTDITQSAHSRLTGLRDGTMSFTAFMDPAAGQSHPVLSALPRTDTLMTFLVPPLSIGSAAACLNAKQVDYDGTRAADGALTFKTQGQGNSFGLEWGVSLTAGLRTDTTATAGTFLDQTAGTAFGAQAYLQVTAFTGTDVTVAVQHATTSGGSYSNIIAFAQTTAAQTFQRAVVSNVTTVNEFVKVTTTTVGGFTSVTFNVVFCRNLTAGVVF